MLHLFGSKNVAKKEQGIVIITCTFGKSDTPITFRGKKPIVSAMNYAQQVGAKGFTVQINGGTAGHQLYFWTKDYVKWESEGNWITGKKPSEYLDAINEQIATYYVPIVSKFYDPAHEETPHGCYMPRPEIKDVFKYLPGTEDTEVCDVCGKKKSKVPYLVAVSPEHTWIGIDCCKTCLKEYFKQKH